MRTRKNSIKYSCTGCAFKIIAGTGIDTRNPLVIGNLTNNGTVVSWNVSALDPINSTWDLFVAYNYTSTIGTGKNTNITKVRVVDYPWWNTSFQCRQVINVTPNTGTPGSGKIIINNFQPDTISCRVYDCDKEIRIINIQDGNQQVIGNISFEDKIT